MTLPRLYKYHFPNQHLIDLLVNKTLYCCDRANLNDPHDGLFLISDSLKSSIAIQMIPNVRKHLSANVIYDGVPDSFILEMAHKSLSDITFYDELHKGENRVSLNICSFTENPENELMWAHYADKFRGVCLEFDFSNVPEIDKVLSKVQYSNETPSVNAFTFEEMKKALSFKREAWMYEQEWRILVEASNKIKFEPTNLKSIYFGPRTTKENINKVINTCKENRLEHVEFKKLNIDLNGMIFE